MRERAAAVVNYPKVQRGLAQAALALEMRNSRNAMLEMAKSHVAVRPDAFDQDPWLLNVHNGTLELRDGKHREHRAEDMTTKICCVHFDAKAGRPLWEAFLDRVFDGDSELIGFVQRAIGYCLSGSTESHAVFVAYGTGRNGKSVLFNTISNLLGPYARSAPSGMLKKRKLDWHPTELLCLDGSRFVTSS
jgi:putative DNA primase/helicase